ncbi:MAG: M28 family peptidase [Coriobacteriia bacterium]
MMSSRTEEQHAACRAGAAFAIACAIALGAPALAIASARAFDASRAVSHAAALARFGVRVEGTAAEARGASYVAGVLRGYGYRVWVQRVTLPNGRASRNVIAERIGRSTSVVVLGAHLDSKRPSPGANDNGSGCGTLLELARDLRGADVVPTVRFAFFGAEESIDGVEAHHHYGSRAYVRSLSSTARARVAGMISVDMVGYGSRFNVRSMGRGPQGLVSEMLAESRSRGVSMTYLADGGRWGWSDHEAFEVAGIPAAWLEWRPDPACHTSGDVARRLDSRRVATTGTFLRAWLLGLRAADLDDWR